MADLDIARDGSQGETPRWLAGTTQVERRMMGKKVQIRTAPQFMEIIGSRAKLDTLAVRFVFKAIDGRQFGVDLDAQILAALIVAMTGHANELAASLPEGHTLPVAALQPKNFEPAMNEAGDLAWKITLDAGLELVLQFSQEQFRALDAKMSEMRELLSRNVQ